MGYLFWGLGDHRPPANRRTPKLEQADKAVVADFMILQSIWRVRRSLRGTSREERQAWKHLIQHLTRLPPPCD